MNPKHLEQKIDSCKAMASLSNCTRRKVGAVIIDPLHMIAISEGYNGTLRGSCDKLCGGSTCLRENVKSGEHLEIGCVHAEQNAIYNATRRGVNLIASWLLVNCEPCLLCAKAIVQCGISKVICIGGIYSTTEGVELLKNNNVEVEMYHV
jgi:dCMP deaminase